MPCCKKENKNVFLDASWNITDIKLSHEVMAKVGEKLPDHDDIMLGLADPTTKEDYLKAVAEVQEEIALE